MCVWVCVCVQMGGRCRESRGCGFQIFNEGFTQWLQRKKRLNFCKFRSVSDWVGTNFRQMESVERLSTPLTFFSIVSIYTPQKGSRITWSISLDSIQTLQEPSWTTFIPMKEPGSRNHNVSLQAYDLMHVPFIRFNLCPIPRFYNGRRDVGIRD
jgi:hypothetical protein